MREQSGVVSEDVLTVCGIAGLVFSFPKVALDSILRFKNRRSDLFFFQRSH